MGQVLGEDMKAGRNMFEHYSHLEDMTNLSGPDHSRRIDYTVAGERLARSQMQEGEHRSQDGVEGAQSSDEQKGRYMKCYEGRHCAGCIRLGLLRGLPLHYGHVYLLY